MPRGAATRGSDGDAGTVSGPVLGRLPGPAAQQVDYRVSDLRRYPDPDRAQQRVRLHVGGLLAQSHVRGVRRGRSAVLRSSAHDPVPAEVSALVVRVEPGATAL